MDERQLYIKLRSSNEPQEYAHYHVHVDARCPLPEYAERLLLDAGFFYDFFDHDYRVYGLNGNPSVPFPSYAPHVHFSFVTRSVEQYKRMWRLSSEIVATAKVPCYLEGEFVVLDHSLEPRKFSQQAYERLVPRLSISDQTPFRFRSAIDKTDRSLPALVRLRRLDPIANGPQDAFRKGEVHLTVRQDTHPRLLELLCNLGFSVPAIPKLIEADDASLRRLPDGSLEVVRDIPLTLQSTDMQSVLRVTNLAVQLIDGTGGLEEGSVKIERAINFALFGAVDYQSDIPPVIDKIEMRPDFRHISADHIGSIEFDLLEAAKRIGRSAMCADHVDKRKQFERVWQRTEQSISETV